VLVPFDPEQQALQLLALGLMRLLEAGLHIPDVGTWRLEEVPADNPPLQTLDVRSWTGSSRVWSTVTPMVFGHVPKAKRGGEPGVILDSLRMIGIEPETVDEIAVGRHSPLFGVPPSWQFKPHPASALGEQGAWMLRHVTLRFNQDVRGPIILGRMRYFGLGLMRPMEEWAWQS
jgi:CRISPR-associated protein Csb2